MELTSNGRQNKEIGTRVSEANAVLRELYRSVVTKRELSNTTKLSFSVFVPILILRSCVLITTERKTLRYRVRNSKIRKTLYAGPLLHLIERSQLRLAM